MANIDPVWDYDYFRKAVSVVLALVLSAFAFLLPKGDAVIAPAGEISSNLTQTEVVAGSHPRDVQTAKFNRTAEPSFLVPGLSEGIIPQGICYDEQNGVYLISGYYEDDTPSRIIVVREDGVYLKSVSVITPGGKQSTGHFGGIAVFCDFVYVASTDRFYVLSLREILAPETDAVNALVSLKTCLPATSGAEVASGVLWLTQFMENAGKVVKESENVYRTKLGHKLYARADGYVLDETAPYGIREENVIDGVAYPDKALAIPQEVQGMTQTADGSFVFSCSYGRGNRSFVIVSRDVTQREPDTVLTLGSALVPLYHCRLCDRTATLTAPPMLQEVCAGPDGRLFFLSESGAAKYRCDGGLDPFDEVLAWRIP